MSDPQPVRIMPRAYFEAEFGSLDSRDHEAVLSPTRVKTPAFLVWPGTLDGEAEGGEAGL